MTTCQTEYKLKVNVSHCFPIHNYPIALVWHIKIFTKSFWRVRSVTCWMRFCHRGFLGGWTAYHLKWNKLLCTARSLAWWFVSEQEKFNKHLPGEQHEHMTHKHLCGASYIHTQEGLPYVNTYTNSLRNKNTNNQTKIPVDCFRHQAHERSCPMSKWKCVQPVVLKGCYSGVHSFSVTA